MYILMGKKYIALDDNGFLQSTEYLRPDDTMSKNAPRYFPVMKIETRTGKLLRPGQKR